MCYIVFGDSYEGSAPWYAQKTAPSGGAIEVGQLSLMDTTWRKWLARSAPRGLSMFLSRVLSGYLAGLLFARKLLSPHGTSWSPLRFCMVSTLSVPTLRVPFSPEITSCSLWYREEGVEGLVSYGESRSGTNRTILEIEYRCQPFHIIVDVYLVLYSY